MRVILATNQDRFNAFKAHTLNKSENDFYSGLPNPLKVPAFIPKVLDKDTPTADSVRQTFTQSDNQPHFKNLTATKDRLDDLPFGWLISKQDNGSLMTFLGFMGVSPNEQDIDDFPDCLKKLRFDFNELEYQECYKNIEIYAFCGNGNLFGVFCNQSTKDYFAFYSGTRAGVSAFYDKLLSDDDIEPLRTVRESHSAFNDLLESLGTVVYYETTKPQLAWYNAFDFPASATPTDDLTDNIDNEQIADNTTPNPTNPKQPVFERGRLTYAVTSLNYQPPVYVVHNDNRLIHDKNATAQDFINLLDSTINLPSFRYDLEQLGLKPTDLPVRFSPVAGEITFYYDGIPMYKSLLTNRLFKNDYDLPAKELVNLAIFQSQNMPYDPNSVDDFTNKFNALPLEYKINLFLSYGGSNCSLDDKRLVVSHACQQINNQSTSFEPKAEWENLSDLEIAEIFELMSDCYWQAFDEFNDTFIRPFENCRPFEHKPLVHTKNEKLYHYMPLKGLFSDCRVPYIQSKELTSICTFDEFRLLPLAVPLGDGLDYLTANGAYPAYVRALDLLGVNNKPDVSTPSRLQLYLIGDNPTFIRPSPFLADEFLENLNAVSVMSPYFFKIKAIVAKAKALDLD